jgi:hypothetical protein
MLALVDPQTLFKNMMLILGGITMLGILFVSTIILITLVRAWMWTLARRRAHEKWMKYARRADGRAYPGTVVGTCDICHRGASHIYAEYSMLLCPMCYEKYWRQAENWQPADREAARASADLSADHG